VQVFELADELGVRNADVLELADAHGLSLEGGADELTDEQVTQLRGAHEFEIAASAEHAGPRPTFPPGHPANQPAPPGYPGASGHAAPPGYPGGPAHPADAYAHLPPPPPGLPGYPAGPPGYPAGPPMAPGPPASAAPLGYLTAPPGYPSGAAPPPPAWPGAAEQAPHSILLAPGQAPPPGYMIEGAPRQMRSQGTHPLVKSSLWYLLGGHFVPCVGPFLMIRAYQLAGQGREHVRWSRGRYSGEGLGQAVQIYCWIYLALVILAVIVIYGGGNAAVPPPTTVP
jgi:hypothetical protein